MGIKGIKGIKGVREVVIKGRGRFVDRWEFLLWVEASLGSGYIDGGVRGE